MTGSTDGGDREREEQIGLLYDTVRRSLTFGRGDEARAAVDELLALAPDSTTAHELHGDVLLSEGHRKRAMEAYKRAIEIEDANVDAERKYAELTLAIGSEDRLRAELAGRSPGELRGAASKQPSIAASRSVLFPGLGQLYNGEYEKGMLFALLAFVLLVPAVQAVVEVLPFLSGDGPAAGWKLWVGLPALILYLALYGYSIYDAWRECKSQDELGVG